MDRTLGDKFEEFVVNVFRVMGVLLFILFTLGLVALLVFVGLGIIAGALVFLLLCACISILAGDG